MKRSSLWGRLHLHCGILSYAVRAGLRSHLLVSALLLAVSTVASGQGAAPAEPVYYEWFEYNGHDAAFEPALPAGY